MALRAGAEPVLVESDFLIGLRSADAHHRHVMQALTMHQTGALSLRLLSSAVVEVRTVLHSRGFGHQVIVDAVSPMDAILAEHAVRESSQWS